MIDTILLDCDGVLADFLDGVARLFNADYQALLAADWDVFKVIGLPENEFWGKIDEAGEKFWEELKKFPWTDELYRACTATGLPVYIVTSPGYSAKAAAGKMNWLKKYYPETIKRMRYFVGSHKYLMAKPNTLLIDDHTKNCEQFRNAGGTALLFPQTWNKSDLTLDDIYVTLEQIKNARLQS